MKITTILPLTACLLSLISFARASVVESAARTPELEQKREYIATVSKLHGDLVYKKVGDLELTLDLMLPLSTTAKNGREFFPDGTPVVIWLHGGGWRNGSRYFSGNDIRFFANHGIASACVSYRLVQDGNGCTVETCVIDCFDAVRWLVKNAGNYGLAPGKVFVYGGSAGAHLALMLAWADADAFKGDPALADARVAVAGAVAIAPVATLADLDARDSIDYLNEKGRFEKLMGGSLPEKMDLAKKASPLYWLKKDSPRTLVIHGTRDQRVSLKGSLMLEERARELGADFTLLRAPNADHSQRGARAPLWRVQGLIVLDNMLDIVQSSYGETDWVRQIWRSATF
ncbi:MAG: alpha/beta hydrolase [Opitutaceae bacterium]|jgi:acetyl esterase/lipase|nr:alpha/beta hydrolase [Opitutaceae bacterium]